MSSLIYLAHWVRAARQLEVKTWAAVQAFVDDWKPSPFRVIAKPMDSAGSEDVTLCRSIQELQAAFGKILGKKNGLGLINNSGKHMLTWFDFYLIHLL